MTKQLFGDKIVTYIETPEDYEEACDNHAWYAQGLEVTSKELAECNEKRKTASNKAEITRLEAEREVILASTSFPIKASELRALLVAQQNNYLQALVDEHD